jgi:hypothetical protein
MENGMKNYANFKVLERIERNRPKKFQTENSQWRVCPAVVDCKLIARIVTG